MIHIYTYSSIKSNIVHLYELYIVFNPGGGNTTSDPLPKMFQNTLALKMFQIFLSPVKK